ncbi:hypothetical protein WSM22_32740 [Cytophagales bacterium WSM2-2]|nr:hypothetical protein WSM22_32740 [Cytophagales bacterium WSM2-2]
MIRLFKNIKIRVKLLLAFSSIILLSVLLTFFAISSISDIISLQSLNEESEKLSINLERIELAAKEFIYEGYKQKSFQENEKSEILDRYTLALKSANESLKHIAENKFLTDQETKSRVDSLFRSSAISTLFGETQALLKKRGFKDFGLEGSLRGAIHKIENSSQKYDRVVMLTLRRHEKDFFLRKDLKYQAEFNNVISAFSAELSKSGKEELLLLLSSYKNEFNQVVDIEKEIGLTDKDGKKGELFAQLQKVRASTIRIQEKVHEQTSNNISRSKVWLVIIFFIQFGVAIVLALTYSNVLTSVIKEIRGTMSQLANGVFPSSLRVDTNEEIGQTKIAINQFLERMKSATSYAEKLGSGNLNARYDERFQGDILARALISMQQKLNEADAIQSKINWNSEGTIKFNELLKNDTRNLHELGDQIVKLLVRHIQANQAALYLVNRKENCFERISTYAYDKKRFNTERVDLDSGLISQCRKEGVTIHVTEVPKDYVKITSGLGEATPRSIVIVPLKNRNEINGVIEIASLHAFEKNHIEFVEKMAETIGAFVANQQTADQTKSLLAESKAKADDLALQEETLRQSAEELQATQEEMNRQRQELENEIKALKEELERHRPLMVE